MKWNIIFWTKNQPKTIGICRPARWAKLRTWARRRCSARRASSMPSRPRAFLFWNPKGNRNGPQQRWCVLHCFDVYIAVFFDDFERWFVFDGFLDVSVWIFGWQIRGAKLGCRGPSSGFQEPGTLRWSQRVVSHNSFIISLNWPLIKLMALLIFHDCPSNR